MEVYKSPVPLSVIKTKVPHQAALGAKMEEGIPQEHLWAAGEAPKAVTAVGHKKSEGMLGCSHRRHSTERLPTARLDTSAEGCSVAKEDENRKTAEFNNWELLGSLE